MRLASILVAMLAAWSTGSPYLGGQTPQIIEEVNKTEAARTVRRMTSTSAPSSSFVETNNSSNRHKPFGFHFETITANGVTIEFGEHPIGSVETIADPTGVRNFELWGSAEFTRFDAKGDGDDLILAGFQRRTNPARPLFDYTIKATRDHTHGSLTLRPEIRMRPRSAPKHCFHYCSIELRIKPPGLGDASHCRAMLPGVSPFVVGWTDETIIPFGSPIKAMHPAASRRGGNASNSFGNPSTDTGIVQYDEPSGNLRPQSSAMSQCFYFWDHQTLEGLLVRTDDIRGQGKVYAISQDQLTREITIEIRFIPQDNSIGTDGNSDCRFDYGVELRPMKGDWNHALAYDTKRKKEQGHPAFSKGRIADRADYPMKAREMTCFAPNFGGFQGFDFQKYLEQHRRLKDYFEAPPWSIGGIWYGTGPRDLGETAPIYGPINTSAEEALREAHADELSAIIYTIPIYNDKDSLNGLEPSLGIAQDLPLCRDNYSMLTEPDLPVSLRPFETEHIAVSAADGGTLYPYVDWTNEGHNVEYAQFIAAQFSHLPLAGFYVDRGGADGPPPNDNPALDAKHRGVGSMTWTMLNRGISALMRQMFGGEEQIVIHEWPSEFSIGEADIVTWESVGVNGIVSTQVFGPSAQFSEYVKHSTFHGYGRGASDQLLLDFPGLASRTEVLNGVFLYWLMGGHMMPVQAFFDQRPNEFFIPKLGEQSYDDWFADAIPHYEFLRHCWWSRRDLVQRFHTGKRLQEMPSTSIVRRKIDERTEEPTEQSMYLYAQGWYDSKTDTLGFNCGNWTQTPKDGGYNNVTEGWNDRLLIEDFPELGTQVRQVTLVDCCTGKEVRLRPYDGLGIYQIDVEMAPGRVVWLLFQ